MQAELQMKLEAEEQGGIGEAIDGSYSDDKGIEEDRTDEGIPALGSKFKQYIDDPTDMEAAERRKKKVSDLAATMEANMAKSSQERWDATEGFQNRKSLSFTRDSGNDDVINDGGFETGVLSSNDVETTRKEIQQEIIINHGTNIARALAALPPNVLHPSSYADVIKVYILDFVSYHCMSSLFFLYQVVLLFTF